MDESAIAPAASAARTADQDCDRVKRRGPSSLLRPASRATETLSLAENRHPTRMWWHRSRKTSDREIASCHHRFLQPIAGGDLGVSAKCVAGGSLTRRNAHQTRDWHPVFSRAAREEVVPSYGAYAGLLRSSPL